MAKEKFFVAKICKRALALRDSTATSSSLLVIDMLTLTLTIKLYLGCLKKFIPHKLVLICYILFFTLSNHYTA